MTFKATLALGLSAVIGLIVILMAVGYWFNRVAVDAALSDVFGALWIAVKVVFFVGLVFGVAYGVIELRRRSRVTVIGHTKHGPVQAIVHNGQLVQLQNAAQQLDPMQQLQMLKTVIQMQGQMAQLARSSVIEERPDVPHIAGPTQERIPAIVRYSDVVDEIPSDMSLLGIHPSDGSLELTSWEKLKMLWVIGSSSTGKSNTVYGKALEARNHGARLMIIDQHAAKPDSLARKLEPLKDAFLRPIATTDDQVLSTLAAFKS